MASEVKKVKKHGSSGYRKGCHCGVCRAAHAADARAWRAAKRAATAAQTEPKVDAPPDPLLSAPQPDEDAPAGRIETALLADLAKVPGDPPWRGTLAALARFNARLLDQASTLDRLDLASPLQLRMLDALDRLRAISAPTALGPRGSAAEEAAQFLADLNAPG